ncbi:hypothetical protein MRX96_008702 [Rhipicephalus microplus]
MRARNTGKRQARRAAVVKPGCVPLEEDSPPARAALHIPSDERFEDGAAGARLSRNHISRAQSTERRRRCGPRPQSSGECAGHTWPAHGDEEPKEPPSLSPSSCQGPLGRAPRLALPFRSADFQRAYGASGAGFANRISTEFAQVASCLFTETSATHSTRFQEYAARKEKNSQTTKSVD